MNAYIKELKRELKMIFTEMANIYWACTNEPDRVWFWLHQKHLLTGERFGLADACRAVVENPRSFDMFYNYKECELICDHTPVWDGQEFSCSNCGLEFVPKRKVKKKHEQTVQKA